MANSITYENLALGWTPDGKGDFRFVITAIVSLLIVMLLGFVLASIDIPKVDRKSRTAIPERIAELVLEKQKEQPKPAIVPEPLQKPEPIPKPKPRVKKEPEKKEQEKPLTESQKKAREKVKDTGLLALGEELADLIDTSSINDMVGGKVAKSSGLNKKASSLDKSLLSENAGKGSAGVNTGDYAETSVGGTTLSAQEVKAIRQSLLSKNSEPSSKTKSTQGQTGNRRAEEEITLVFDQNKSKLYSIYNRERRKNPGLKGKIVLEITIAPEGKVVAVRIVSSELNNPKLERSLVSRIKLFKFSAGKIDAITVTFPIEFLPS